MAKTKSVPDMWRKDMLYIAKQFQEHTHIFLTKQPHNLAKFSPFPDNCWVGVSVTNTTQYYDTAYWLREIKAKVKFISFEPLLERILPNKAWPWRLSFQEREIWDESGGINWVIIGAQSKPTIMPKIEWVQEIVSACDTAGIPVFLKDSLKELITLKTNMNDTWAAKEWVQCKYPILRQEFPAPQEKVICTARDNAE